MRFKVKGLYREKNRSVNVFPVNLRKIPQKYLSFLVKKHLFSPTLSTQRIKSKTYSIPISQILV